MAQFRMDTIPNGHNPEWTQSRMAQFRMDTIPNGHNPEWSQYQMNTIPNEDLQVTEVFYCFCLVRSLLRRRGFEQKLIH